MIELILIAIGRRLFIVVLLIIIFLTSCAAIGPRDTVTSPITPGSSPEESTVTGTCPVPRAEWVKPPDDSAVEGSPGYGYYWVNEDRSIWASAWWTESDEYRLRADDEGMKVGWFRPAGATLEITGQRIDVKAPPLEADIPCCYPTRFQATGLQFPTEGCWEVLAKAVNSELSFVLNVQS